MTSKWVLHTPFEGQNHLFQCFQISFYNKWNKEEKAQEKIEKYMKKGVYQYYDATPKHLQTPESGLHVGIFLFA